MRCWAVLFAIVAVAGFASEASAGEKIRLAQTSTITKCMMTCNSQAATCQTACFVRRRRRGDTMQCHDDQVQSDLEHVVHHELHDPAAKLSDDLRQNIAIAVIGPASNCRD